MLDLLACFLWCLLFLFKCLIGGVVNGVVGRFCVVMLGSLPPLGGRLLLGNADYVFVSFIYYCIERIYVTPQYDIIPMVIQNSFR